MDSRLFITTNYGVENFCILFPQYIVVTVCIKNRYFPINRINMTTAGDKTVLKKKKRGCLEEKDKLIMYMIVLYKSCTVCNAYLSEILI